MRTADRKHEEINDVEQEIKERGKNDMGRFDA